MKRGGRIYIIAGVVLALAAGALLFLYLNQVTRESTVRVTPTPVPDVDVMVLSRDVANGAVITGDMIRRASRKATDSAIADAVRDPSEALGRMLVTDGKAEQMLKRGDLQVLPFVIAKGKKAMALSVDDLSNVAGLVREGDYIDVVISGKVKVQEPTPVAGATPAAKPQGAPAGGENDPSLTVIQPVADQTVVKTVLQRIQVLKVVQPPQPQTTQQAQQQQAQQQQAAASGTPAATPVSQQPQGKITNAKAIVVLAVTDQEAELLRFANDTGGMQLLLRGRDDAASEETKGMTLDILIRDYGLPVPKPIVVDNTPRKP